MQVRDGWAWLVSMPESIRRLVTFPVDGVHSARLGRTVSREDVDDVLRGVGWLRRDDGAYIGAFGKHRHDDDLVVIVGEYIEDRILEAVRRRAADDLPTSVPEEREGSIR